MLNCVLFLLALYLGLSLICGIAGAIYWYKMMKRLKKEIDEFEEYDNV